MRYSLIPELPERSEECKEVVRQALQNSHDRMCRIEKRQEAIINKQEEIEQALAENTRITSENADKSDKVYEALMTMKGGMRAFGLIGRFLKWGAGIGVAVYSIWCVVNGKSPF